MKACFLFLKDLADDFGADLMTCVGDLLLEMCDTVNLLSVYYFLWVMLQIKISLGGFKASGYMDPQCCIECPGKQMCSQPIVRL
jgi:hypothetical protein